jgi:hypothetical protein
VTKSSNISNNFPVHRKQIFVDLNDYGDIKHFHVMFDVYHAMFDSLSKCAFRNKD